MTRSRLFASLLAAGLMVYLFANGAIGLGYKAWIIPGMVVMGWVLVFFGDELATWLEMPESNNPTVVALQNYFIQGLGYLAMGLVSALVVIRHLRT